jgi:hypothetical protein
MRRSRQAPFGQEQKDPSAVKARSNWFASIMALAVGAAPVAIAIAAEDWDQGWMVAMLARDGSRGVGIDRRMTGASAAAIRDCKAISSGGSDCGAEWVARGGWIIGLRCDDYRILVTRKDLKKAEVAALHREIDLKQLYAVDMPACRRVLTVGSPDAVPTEITRFSDRP